MDWAAERAAKARLVGVTVACEPTGPRWRVLTFTGKSRVTGADRPLLRVAAWRAVWGCLQTNRVDAAHCRHLVSIDVETRPPAHPWTQDTSR